MPLVKILIPDFLLAQISATNFRRLKQQWVSYSPFLTDINIVVNNTLTTGDRIYINMDKKYQNRLKHFTSLKFKYQATKYQDSSPASLLYLILRKVDLGIELLDLDLEQLLTPYGEVQAARRVAGEVRQIDVYFIPKPQPSNIPETLGLLGQLVTTPSLFEPFRNAASATEICDCLLKLGTSRE
ncbi:hypothetical protein [Nostoc sp.]|uniref:hypothetical protein n=1 Tax=Nostoc sp. TaxID=1180 RepID=UPI002FFC461C